MLHYTTEKTKTNRILDLTSLTVEEFEEMLPAFEAAYVRHMQQWTMEGKPRTARSYTAYANSPLPTAEDRLFFLLTYLKVAAIQVAHAALFDMTQSNANKWIHLLLLVLHQTLRELGDAPARHLNELRKRFADLQAPDGSLPPLFTMMAPNDQSRAPAILVSKKRTIVARRSVTL
jgi:hypothetical protein